MFDGGKITKWKQGEYEFSIRQMSPFKAMKVLGDLQKVIIPALGGAAAGLNNTNNDALITTELIASVGGALFTLTERLNGDELEKACKLLLDTEYLAVKESKSKSFVQVSQEDLEAIYTGRPWDMLALCVKIFEVNFMDFSQSSTVPIGVQKLIAEIVSTFRAVSGSISVE